MSARLHPEDPPGSRPFLPAGVPALQAAGITNTFPGVLANDAVDFELRAGEIHALLGENGSGKTTLARTLAGLHSPDAGSIRVRGKEVKFSSPRQAFAEGIFLIQQNFSLVDRLTVAENVILGRSDARLGRRHQRALSAEITELGRVYGLEVSPSAGVWQLSMGERQRVEIIKALYRRARILILDEPTTVLTPQECERLFAGLRRLAAEGTSIVFISHKLPEVLAVSQRVTILRRGKSVATADLSLGVTAEQLAQMMFGRDITLSRRTEAGLAQQVPVALTVEELTCHDPGGHARVQAASLAVRQGEILGVTGVAGNGQRELAEAITGLRRRTGTVAVAGRALRNGDPAAAMRAGLAYVPEDRFGAGLVPDLPISENLVLKSAWGKPYSRFGVLNPKAMRAQADRLIAEFGIAGTPRTAVGQLSGGNAQRVLLARELTSKPKVIVAATPTRGLDIAATESVRRLLIEATRTGMAVLLISEDLDEVLQLCDRIAVMYRGRVVDVVARQEADAESLGLMMTGIRA
jgi:simple sugar transport system ATP-binding protein